MRSNSFVGEVPKSFENCTSLVVLDLAHNLLTGCISTGIGNLQSLSILNFRWNNISGDLPVSLCQLSHLQILDLSFNHISWAIPECIYNLTAMMTVTNLLAWIFIADYFEDKCNDYAVVMWKGEQSFLKTLGLVRCLAFSNNQLQGQIPSGISVLRGLDSLELAGNNLTGAIPLRIGVLTSLQVLNLSSNHLFGEIPASLASVSSLEILDLSNNDLSGRIPQGTQLWGFDRVTYMGNPGLCEPPLPICPGDEAAVRKPKGLDIAQKEENKSDDILLGFYISAVQVCLRFWGVCGSLVLKRSWRHAYFRFLGQMKDRLHVMVVNIARVWRRP